MPVPLFQHAAMGHFRMNSIAFVGVPLAALALASFLDVPRNDREIGVAVAPEQAARVWGGTSDHQNGLSVVKIAFCSGAKYEGCEIKSCGTGEFRQTQGSGMHTLSAEHECSSKMCNTTKYTCGSNGKTEECG